MKLGETRQYSNFFLGIIIVLILIAPALLLPDEGAGYLLISFSFVFLLFFKEFRQDKRLFIATAVTLVPHHLVAFYNAYMGTVAGAVNDPTTFHMIATELARTEQIEFSLQIGHVLYINLLGLFYQFFGASVLFGQQLSILVYSFSCVVLVRLIKLLGWESYRISIVLLYGLLPSVAIHTSLTQREPLQSLLFLLSLYWVTKLRKKPTYPRIGLFLLSVIGFGLLHHALAAYAPFLVMIGLYWGLRIGEKKGIWRKLILVFVVGTVIISWFLFAESFLKGVSQVLISGDILEYTESYRSYNLDSRASYGNLLDTSSFSSFLLTVPLVFIYYLFAPFPWQIATVLDIYAFLESLLRFMLLCSILYFWKGRISKEQKSIYNFLLICFFSLELLWAMGTKNWGTAIRHHVVAYSILVVLGGPGLTIMLQKFLPTRKRYKTKES